MNQEFFYSHNCDRDMVEKKKRNPCSLPPCSVIIGPTGPTGPTGTSGILGFADFYALMPPDNAATVAPGTDVSFSQDGPTLILQYLD